MPLSTPSSSLTENVYARLRADILSIRLEPGQKLKIEDLCLRFSAGSSAVREALSRLASENFVSLEPQRGFRVTELSIDDFRDLTHARIQVESLCIRAAIEQGDLEWEANFIGALHRMSGTPTATPDDPKHYSQAFADAHTAFHEALVAACPSNWLLKMRRFLFAQSERYRFLSLPLAKVERDLHSEHRSIAAAALARDADRCVASMETHLSLTAQTLMDASVEGIAPFLANKDSRLGKSSRPDAGRKQGALLPNLRRAAAGSKRSAVAKPTRAGKSKYGS